ncbi:M13 family peptidase [Stagnimonas aquatica]|uniref:M13 family peptidase n=1 Tax=Stagnimonas aquatica TaxID=2689987 RepID=A0A3N0VLX6_9GAMM|nr:M13-type metalloendopeptidase [Stagnimonas aquatica]ROH93793.1 M13 family peptidase [Stagnimonas aquatica]
MNRFVLSAMALALLVACGKKEAPPAAEVAAPAVAVAPVSGIDLSQIDAAVRPQDDLYRHLNGKWLDSFEIPADKSNYGSFTKLDDQAQEQLKAIIETAAASKDRKPGSEQQKVGDFFASFMDEAKLEELGIKPLAAEFAAIDALKDKKALSASFARLSRLGAGSPLFLYIHQDAKDASQYTADLVQAGLGLPERDYYLQDDAKFKDIRAQYLKHLETVFGLAGLAEPTKAAKAVLALETQLAKGHWDKVKNRDPVATYNKLETGKLATLTAAIDWPAYLDGLGLATQPALVVSQPSYVSALGKAVQTVSLDDWKVYLKWQLLASFSPYLSKPYVDANFAFFKKTLNGQQEIEPRWKRGVDVVEFGSGGLGFSRGLSEVLGKLYVEKHFPPEAKARMETLVKNLLTAYGQSIDGLSWMSDETKAAAKVKLSKFTTKIGYPDQWRDYSAFEVKADDLYGNLVRGAEFDYQRNLAKLGKPIDRQEWIMSPQTVNAYYNPEMNEIVFPAAILQPPFFDLNADDAVNYGGIGAVIGHEISHGFDDQGSQYDGDGNLRMWWTKEDRAKFDALGAKLAAQYDSYEPVKGYHVNGKFTLGENIGDLGGLTVAHKAYVLSLAGKEAPVIDGYTGEQRFFLGWAQVWRRKYREENLLTRIKTDPHSPSEFRANGTPVNVPAFHAAFGTKEGDKMYKPEAERIVIW